MALNLYRRLIQLGAPTKGMFWAAVSLCVIALVASCAILIPRKAMFSAEVLTEQFEVEIPRLGLMPFQDGVLLDLYEAPAGSRVCTGPVLHFDGDPSLGVNQSDGPLNLVVNAVSAELFAVKVSAAAGRTIGATVTCADASEHAAPREVRFSVPRSSFAGSTFQFQGAVTLGGGALVGTRNDLRILREGTIRVTARSFPLGSGVASDSVTLLPADTVRFFSSARGGLAEGTLIARYEPQEVAFRIVAHTPARQAEVYRVGSGRSDTMSVAPTLWARVQAQREWAILLVILAILIKFLEICRSQYSAEQENANNKKSGRK